MLRPPIKRNAKETYLHELYQLEKRYYELRNNLLGLKRNELISELEEKVMESEVKKALKAWGDIKP